MKALVVAGGVPQIELIQQLKERGIETVLIDGSDNPIARPFCDDFVRVQIFDIEAVKKVAIEKKVDFLITVCADQVLLVVAQVSEMLGLPCYIDYKTAQDVSDKLRMKQIFKDHGIPTSSYVRMDTLDLDAIRDLKFPLVVKPVDAYSSRGVRKCEDIEELKKYWVEASEISRSGDVIVEEFCPGTEISVDAFIVDGKAHILCVSNSEKVKDADRFVIFRGRYPVCASQAVLDEIEEIAQKITDAFGLVNAPLLVQMINDGEHVSVLEFCARTGGNMKWLLIKHSCGVDVITATIDITLGRKPDISFKETGNDYVVNDFIYCHEGIYDHVEGFDELVKEGVINEYHVSRPVGWHLFGNTNSSSDRICGVNIVANSLEEFNEKHRRFAAETKVVSSEGEDLMRHDLLPDLEPL
ncbi:MAG: ATP-grasp domain-containing protein [Lachnospiraceae bacterium]|nr:ATP-grasp domain-containing protein [Lachnospiraceae bacterium]